MASAGCVWLLVGLAHPAADWGAWLLVIGCLIGCLIGVRLLVIGRFIGCLIGAWLLVIGCFIGCLRLAACGCVRSL